ncbi:MAG: maleylpyruvate isomerase family mycothiol-dependent enzyme [Actinomycetota bacterium]
MDHAAAYTRVRERIESLVSEPVAETEIPTCPGWTVKDMIAHLADFFEVATYGPKGGFSEDWGERGVAKRAGLSLEDCLDEWRRRTDEGAAVFESPLAGVAVADVLSHEQDIRTAIGRPGGTDDENIGPAVMMALSFLGKKAEAASLPTLRVVTDDIDHTIGDGEPAATLHTSTFDLFRVLHGRRTVQQIEEMKWDGRPGAWTENIFIFGPTEEKVEG